MTGPAPAPGTTPAPGVTSAPDGTDPGTADHPGTADQPGTAVDTSTVRQRARARWRRWRWTVLVGGVVLVGALVTALLVPSGTRGDLDPESTAPSGGRALARILADQGVDVTRVTRSTDVADTADPRTTVVVVHPDLLGPEQLDRLTGTGSALVLVEPDALTLESLAGFARVAGTTGAADADPGCTDPAALAAGRARAGGHLYRSVTGSAGGCYPHPGESDVVTLLRGRADGREVTVLGQGDVLRNEWLASQGNAALALRILGSRPRLLWYLPDPLELSAEQSGPSPEALLPPWVRWVTLQLLIALVLALLWRARRLGPLVTEPLPVVVRSAETQEGRARLYRQAGARDRAAAALRTATARRLAARLDVPPDADPAAVAELAAQISGQPVEQVHDTLLGPAPGDDTALIRLADRLDVLERTVGAARVATGRRTARPPGDLPPPDGRSPGSQSPTGQTSTGRPPSGEAPQR